MTFSYGDGYCCCPATTPASFAGYGPTANRPVSPPVPSMWFDTTLGIPVWWNGVHWVNYAGATV